MGFFFSQSFLTIIQSKPGKIQIITHQRKFRFIIFKTKETQYLRICTHLRIL
jgi:hypothetical protein